MASEAALMARPPQANGLPDFGKVAVVMGGWSAEREVSLMSGQCVLDALIESGVDAHAVDADSNLIAELTAREFDRVFLILHGRGGEDGHIQGALELAGIPYTGSGVMASALSMDKHRAKLLASTAGVPTPEALCVSSLEAAQNAVASIGLPVVIKPTLEGSSIGVSMVREFAEIAAAFALAASHGEVLVERMMTGMEVTATILGDEALPLVSMRAQSDFYDYHAKYVAEDTRYDCPPQLDPDVQRHIQQQALAVFAVLGCRHWGRVDFMLDGDGVPHFIECNTVPGMTSHSLVPMAAREAGLSFAQLVVSILAETVKCTEASS